MAFDFDSLTEEQKAMARECKNMDELIALADAEGIELSSDDLEQLSGGVGWAPPSCSINMGPAC